MQFHIHNTDDPTDFDIDQAQWQDATGGAHPATFGTTPEEFAAANPEALITPVSQLRRLLAQPATRLKYAFLLSAGVDRLHPFDFLPPGVRLVNNSGTHAAKVAEYAAMALVMLSTRMPAYVGYQREERWQPHFTPTLAGRHLVVLGTGDLGAAAARSARHFGMTVTGVRARNLPHPDFDTITTDLDATLPAAEFLFLATPLTPATSGILSRARIARLPAGASIANVGRGALIDQDALCDALDSGHLNGAILDVTTPEPPPPGHRLWHTRNLVLTPHVAADSPATYNRDSLRIFLENLAALEAGHPAPNEVDITRGY